MYEIYLNICSFIRFSGIDPNYKTLERKELADIINSKKPIKIKFPKYEIIIYHKNTTTVSYSDLNKLANENPDIEYIFIKSSWIKGKPENAIYMSFEDFELNIEPKNRYYNIEVFRNGAVPNDFNFYELSSDGLPKILTSDILAKWLLLKEGDIISYTLFTEEGFYKRYREAVDYW